MVGQSSPAGGFGLGGSYPVLYLPAPLLPHARLFLSVCPYPSDGEQVPTLSLWGTGQIPPAPCFSCPQPPKQIIVLTLMDDLGLELSFCSGPVFPTAQRVSHQDLGCSHRITHNPTLNEVKGTRGVEVRTALFGHIESTGKINSFLVFLILVLWMKAFHSVHPVLMSHKEFKQLSRK